MRGVPIELDINCMMCKRDQHLVVGSDDIKRFNGGQYAQVAFDYLTPAQREVIISRVCPECWDRVMGEEEY